MKTCPLCAEEIRPNALICKHCGRPYLADVGQLDTLGPAVSVGRLASGYGVEAVAGGYGVWNMATGGAPFRRYQPDEKGWRNAMKDYDYFHRPGEGGGGGGFGVGVAFPLPT
jgi:hypothetical protein